MSGVFISHSSLDRKLVERKIIAPLRRHGVETWYSNDDIKPAVDFERSIHQGLEGCEWFLVALTPRAVASDWVKSEVDWALQHRPGRVIPVLLEDCDPKKFHLRLRLVEHVDFRRDPKRAIKELIEKLKPGARPPGPPTPLVAPWIWRAATLFLLISVTLALLWFFSSTKQTYVPAGNAGANNAPAASLSNQAPAGADSNSSGANSQQGNKNASGSAFRERPDRLKASDLGGSNK